MDASRAAARARAASVWPAWPASPGMTSVAAPAASAPAGREQLCHRARRPLRAVDRERDRSRHAEEGEHELELEVAAPERRGVRTAGRARRDRTPSGARTGRSRARRRPALRPAGPRARRGTRSRAAAARSRSRAARRGRAISARRTNSPSAANSERNTTQRAIRSCGVAAVSLSDGHAELRRRPRVRADREREGAAHRVAVDRDHAPVDEVPALGDLLERHDERLRLGRRPLRRARRSTWWPAASVTETIAKRGSTGSL